jgi:transposase
MGYIRPFGLKYFYFKKDWSTSIFFSPQKEDNMSTSYMYHTQLIKGFKHQRYFYQGDNVIQRIKRKKFRCRHCKSSKITASKIRDRKVQGPPCGTKKVYFEFDVHKVYCSNCKQQSVEEFSFLSHPKARITKALERTLIELRPMMSIADISRYYDVDWRTIKKVELAYLKKKYAKIPLIGVTAIGIDEIHVHKKADKDKNKEKFITVVRDLISGAVLYIGQGKSAETLAPFQKKLEKAECRITFIAMDMSVAFTSWATNNHPLALIVYDHFHVIKGVQKAVDDIRKRVCAEVNEQKNEKARKELKGNRFLFLYGKENLSDAKKEKLDYLREQYKDLGDAVSVKEELRSIYRNCTNAVDAAEQITEWIETTKETGVKELIKVAKSVEKHFEGILAYWHSNKITSAAMEGFNNKIRWLIRQAYGFHDEEYFHFKIYDLPTIKTTKSL